MKKEFKLPNMEHKFQIQSVGSETGINWVGDFVYRRPNLQERAMIEVMTTRLNGDLMTLDPDVRAFNEALAHLRFTIKEYPEWWKETDFGGSLYDANIVIDIYNKCIEFEANWKKRIHGDASQVESGNENQVAVSTPS